MSRSYYVIDSPLGAADSEYFEKFHAALAKIGEHGVSLQLCDRRETPSQICLKYSDEQSKLIISMWDDYVGDVRYLEVSTEDGNLHDLAVRVLKDKLPVLENVDILGQAEIGMAANPKILYKVAYSAPEAYHDPTFQIIAKALRNDSAEVRAVAATIAGILGWSQLKPELEKARDEEELPGEAKLAIVNALDGFQ